VEHGRRHTRDDGLLLCEREFKEQGDLNQSLAQTSTTTLLRGYAGNEPNLITEDYAVAGRVILAKFLDLDPGAPYDRK